MSQTGDGRRVKRTFMKLDVTFETDTLKVRVQENVDG